MDLSGVFQCLHNYSILLVNHHVYESQGFTEDQDKEKDRDSQDHRWSAVNIRVVYFHYVREV